MFFSALIFSARAWAGLSLSAVGAVAMSPDAHDGQSVCVEGTAENIRETVSSKGNPYFTLSLREGEIALKVFSFGHADFTAGQTVLACGRFHKENRVGDKTFANELTACLVEPPPGLFGPALHGGRRPQFTGPVTGVMDGDTLDVLAQGRARRIRLEGVDCPEKGQAFGDRAKRFSSGLVLGKRVSVEVVDIDKYGRMVAWVRMGDGRFLNEEIVRAGMGWWYKKFAPENQTLERLEADARSAKRGLWIDNHPVPPWEFRHRGDKNR